MSEQVDSGVVVVDKAAGMTSHDVVARVRRLAGTRKVGHAGTLDPMATGVLVVGVNRATRLLGHLMLTDKTYEATIRLGASTTTDDAEGEVTSSRPAADLADETIRSALAGFVGEIDQVPASVSAVKVAGRRAYDRVRAGEEVELAARRVRIEQIDVHGITRDEHANVADVAVEVHCSTGTYIRSIARDLGEALGVGGHLVALRRTSVGPFGLEVGPHPRRARREVRAGADDRGGPRELPVVRPRRAPGDLRALRPQGGARPRPSRRGGGVRAGW